MTKQLDRRTLLKGAGLGVGLPLLDAMRPARADEQAAPVRMAFVFFPNGAIMPKWNPSGKGKNYELSETLKTIEDLRDDFNDRNAVGRIGRELKQGGVIAWILRRQGHRDGLGLAGLDRFGCFPVDGIARFFVVVANLDS